MGENRSDRKHRAILDAATEVFLRNGYLGTTVEEVAAVAGVSKPTVYKHFTDKRRLFLEIVAATVDEAGQVVQDAVSGLADTRDVEADLRELARRQLALVLRPRVVQLRRLVIGETSRFPELGRTFYERGPGRTIAALAKAFADLDARGALLAADPVTAATQFNWLVMSAPVNQAMLLGDDRAPTALELDHHVEGAVRVFLAAYGPAARPRESPGSAEDVHRVGSGIVRTEHQR
ncbi:TetR/AcrR family transcriptional regulator [Streptosporangium sp. NPDC023615]|uniref:TetR/AcrR family transcriptional regulator n=1 Tax=Streptosporangium sp. NPDC023615 TaxID=3154794 RepID=UPI00343FD6C1